MSSRQSVYSKGFSHKMPIPNACRLGNILVTGLVNGVDPETGKIPSGLDEQVVCLFKQIRLIVEAGGGATDDIVKITVWMADRGDRTALNREWLAMFPDPNSRPARQAMISPMEGGKLIQCDFMAVIREQ
jgi:2-iminobutanoate/2-iminopropanoate deaminase